MSLVESFQAAHKARLARIAAQAVKPPQPVPQPVAVEIVPEPEPVAVPPPLGVLDYRLTADGGPVRIERILKVVCQHFCVSSTDLVSARRTGHLILPRHIVYCLCKQLTLHSLPAVGRRLGGRNHATILYGVRKIERMLTEDDGFRAMFDELVARIGGSDQSEKRKARVRLTETQVREIRASNESLVELAKRYGVTHGAIWHVINYRTWAHLNEQGSGETSL